MQTDRGGQITYHGPGQVVAYPLVDMRRLGIYVKELVFRIEQAVIQTLEGFGVDARRVNGAPGVYVPWRGGRAGGTLAGRAKIAALGIKVTHGRSYHGVALNVRMDLAPFALINPCGYAGLPIVDLAPAWGHGRTGNRCRPAGRTSHRSSHGLNRCRLATLAHPSHQHDAGRACGPSPCPATRHP